MLAVPGCVSSDAVGGGATSHAEHGILNDGLLQTAYGHDVALPDPEPPPAVGYARYEGYFPNTDLTTSDGRRVKFYDDLIRDKTVLINFMYTDCDGI